MTDRNRVSWGEVFTGGVIVAASSYLAYHMLRFFLVLHMQNLPG